MNQLRKIMVTCALPYANGSIHIGHILEHIQADIWVRYHKMRGHEVYFICADDAHGTPIMLKAQELNISPEQMIIKMNKEHQRDFANFHISYDNYYSTHSRENRYFSELIYNRLKNHGFIKTRIISQLYDSVKGIFLPDRFVKGKCPKCKSTNQYGDNCEVCGAIYNQIDLIEPKSVMSNVTPEIRYSEHLFFDLPYFADMLYQWIRSGILQEEVANKIQEWFNSTLQEWDISRDAPYFGFEIPNTIGKYFYVWLDAPIGYISAFKNLCNKNKTINFEEFWKKDSDTELYHFIGKDIIYFHGLFWPAMLHGSNFRKPDNLFVHGYVNVNGTKMSKSRGTFIKASTWLKYFDSDSLRYYYATKLSSRIDDINLNLEDFVYRINSDIVNKIVNLASRSASFIEKYFRCKLSAVLADADIYNSFIDSSEGIGKYLENREYHLAVRNIMNFTDIANRYIDEQAPWTIYKQEKSSTRLHAVCSMGIHLFKIILTWLKPIVPSLSKKVECFLNTELRWNTIHQPLLNHKIMPFRYLYKRLEMKKIHMLLQASQGEYKGNN